MVSTTGKHGDSFALGIHAMPCTNHCQHCWTEGSPRHPRIPAEQVFFVLEKLAELRERFLVGTLGAEGFPRLLESYDRDRPRPLPLLDQITWGELARRYGDRESDELYYLHDLPENKWAARYLLDCEASAQ